MNTLTTGLSFSEKINFFKRIRQYIARFEAMLNMKHCISSDYYRLYHFLFKKDINDQERLVIQQKKHEQTLDFFFLQHHNIIKGFLLKQFRG